MRSNYKRIGDYIREVKTRNTELKTTRLLGINIDKFFMPSVANIVGTDMSVYKIVKYEQFACNRMHVGRDYRLPIALSKSTDDFIVSPAYDVFEVIDENVLFPDYLMMWFSRKEFDRNAWFYTDADVRGGLHWKAFCDMRIPIPSLDKQKEIVKEYNVILTRIELNNKLIKRLEETAQSVYKNWFVDFEFPDENGKPYKSNGGEMIYNEELEKDIPKGWEIIPIQTFCKDMKSGGTPSRDNNEYWHSNNVPWLKTGEISNNILLQSEEFISHSGLKNSSAKILPINTVLMAMYGVTAGQIGFLKFESSANQACCGMICNNINDASYLFYYLLTNQKYIKSLSIGGAQPNLSKALIENLLILKPSNEILNKEFFSKLINTLEKLTKDNICSKKLCNLLLSKLATIEN